MIKALSAEEIAELKAGEGMGLALAAELNGYPGPRHVLDLADELRLTEKQRREVRALFDAMRSEAVDTGERLIAEEAALDREFAERTITPARLDAATRAIGSIAADLRATHLRYHLATRDLLLPEQVWRYNALRGYSGNSAPMHHHGGHSGAQ
ncbi:MAG TPA: Spy/CpxP family protein refolding chaperone [Propylenella sp.]